MVDFDHDRDVLDLPVRPETVAQLGQTPERCRDLQNGGAPALRSLYRCPLCDGIYLHDPEECDRPRR